jgi:hypothetical protein
MIEIDWLDPILVFGCAHRCLLAVARDPNTAFVPSGALPKSASEHGVFRWLAKSAGTTNNRKITIVRKDRSILRSATARSEFFPDTPDCSSICVSSADADLRNLGHDVDRVTVEKRF